MICSCQKCHLLWIRVLGGRESAMEGVCVLGLSAALLRERLKCISEMQQEGMEVFCAADSQTGALVLPPLLVVCLLRNLGLMELL